MGEYSCHKQLQYNSMRTGPSISSSFSNGFTKIIVFWMCLKKKYNKITHIPGDSWSLTICLSVNCDRLWIRVKQWFVLQLVQSVGSAIRPLSISTDVVREHTIHLKNDSRISGIMLLVRITIPLIVISWSISIKLGPV